LLAAYFRVDELLLQLTNPNMGPVTAAVRPHCDRISGVGHGNRYISDLRYETACWPCGILRSGWLRKTDHFRACGVSSSAHIRAMAKVRVIFKMKRVAEDDWQIEAHYPGAEIRYIKGLKSKADVDDWLQGTRRIDWLRSQGYAK
jgi:hypothetical protein